MHNFNGKVIIAALLSLLLVACGQSGTNDQDTGNDMDSSATMEDHEGDMMEEGTGANEAIATALAHPDRSEADKARDVRDKTAEVLTFWGIEPGMDVLDFLSGGGYFSELVARVVGEDGSVIAHNNAGYNYYAGEAADARFADSGLNNIARQNVEWMDIQPAENSLDAVLMVNVVHDAYHASPVAEGVEWPAIDLNILFQNIANGLRPGGVVGVMDHRAAEGLTLEETGNSVHRMDPQIVIDAAEGAGLVLEAETDLLANPEDDLTKSVFDPEIRGSTDRFILKFRKPE